MRRLVFPFTWLLLFHGGVPVAHAQGADSIVDPHLDVKSFWTAVFPDDNPWMRLMGATEPIGSGVVNARGRLTIKPAPFLKFQVHHALTGSVTTVPDGLGLGAGAGVGQSVPQWVDLNWEGEQADGLTVQGQTDRLLMKANVGIADLTLGRQAITFGTGRFFTPIDLVNPFHPATVDTEYKPGTDAFRSDVYVNETSVWTSVVAYTGTDDEDAWVVASYGGWTVGVTDLGVFGALFVSPESGLENRVLGLSSASSIGAVGVYGDASLTLSEEDAFGRAVLGADYRATPTTTLNLEGYYQGNGASSVDDYLGMFQSDAMTRGEIWALGQSYGALAVMQELTPTLQGSLAALVNLQDVSSLVLPSVDVSVSDNVAWTSGAFIGVGQRPDEGGIQSEFGLYPNMFFTQMRAYF